MLIQLRHLSSRAWVARESGTPRDVLKPQVLPVEDGSCRKLINQNVTVKINAVSLNPIDHWLVNGRGENIRKAFKRLPPGTKEPDLLIPGRDFHATVLSNDGGRFFEGDDVIGVKHPFNYGTLSQYISVPEHSLHSAISTLTPEENACLPFGASTLFSSFGLFGGLSVFGDAPISDLSDFTKKRCLVIGATGGIGSLLVQILNQNNSKIIDGIGGNLDDLEKLPLRKKLNYKTELYKSDLEQNDYDFIFDCADGTAHKWVGEYLNDRCSYLISYSSPLLDLIGSASILSIPEFTAGHRKVEKFIKTEGGHGANFRYGFFTERNQYFDLMQQFDFKPKISKIFPFDQVPDAFESMLSERHFGKVVITMSES